MRELVESKNYPELYNCYALWITDNRQFFSTGNQLVKIPDSKVKKPFGFRSFLKTFITDDSKLHTVEQDASEYLSAYPDEFVKNADIFYKQFPTIVKNRQEKLKAKTNRSNAKLTEHFEQLSVDLTPPKSQETETERLLAMAQKHGAKMFKKGDLEIHF